MTAAGRRTARSGAEVAAHCEHLLARHRTRTPGDDFDQLVADNAGCATPAGPAGDPARNGRDHRHRHP